MFDYTKYLEKFLIKIKVPYVSRENIMHIYSCISDTLEKKKKIYKIISKYKSVRFDYFTLLKEFEDFALPRLRNKCEVDVLCICLLTKKLEELYKEKGFSNKLFIDTVSDIRWKINECEMVEKLSGIFCASWYVDIFKMKTFGLGRLQYQIVDNCYNVPNVKKNQKMLSIHIPKNNERLEPKKVDESIKMAKKFFFEKFHINQPIFVCHSWLLFPENKKFLDKNSNIVKFANRFEIFKTDYDKDYSELWRIFDRKFKDIRSLEANSSLRIGYKELVLKHKPIGSSIGYFRG